jgi:hypothetical protein
LKSPPPRIEAEFLELLQRKSQMLANVFDIFFNKLCSSVYKPLMDLKVERGKVSVSDKSSQELIPSALGVVA